MTHHSTMNRENTITILVVLILLISALAAGTGIFSDAGPGGYTYESIRGQTIEIYGRGIYQHMSADVAIQGIAQDYITLFLALPLLLISLIAYRKGSMRGTFLLAGTLGYFLVTYLFYTAMGMYNSLFLAYVSLLGLSFFAFLIVLSPLRELNVAQSFSEKTPHKPVGWFLIFNAVLMGVLWLSVVLPPLFDGTIYPEGLAHYTTLIVQGFDLGLLLPIGFISGLSLLRKKPEGFIYAPVFLVFLSILMTALTAKVIAMAMDGINVIPVVFIIPTILLIAIVSVWFMITRLNRRCISC